MAALFDQSDIEKRIGVVNVARYCDDDGDGVADSAVLASIIEEATAYAQSLLGSAWSNAQIALLAQDPRLIGAMCDLAAGLMGERKPEWRDVSGKFPYAERFARGKESLKAIGKGDERLGKEETHGSNRTIGGAIAVSADHVFAPSRTKPSGPGGF